jgi:HK97 gp10 family phage protein
MARVKTQVISTKPRYNQVIRDYTSHARQLVGRAGNLVRNTAVDSINQGAKSGVTYQKYNPRRTHKASAAGEPPATDTGFLVSNIFLNVDADGLGASVESRAEYSSFLEFGTSKMGARPFMQPALEENKPKIRRLAGQMVKAK